jgi:hypothetical protein
MINVAMSSDPTPMWPGWNALVTETLNISKKVAAECADEYAVVHYDLAVAKLAMLIQAEEVPRYDNIFICFGPFHILLAYFGALGHILDGSGGPHILMDVEVLGSGSLNGFLLGKHYNRYCLLH